MELSKLTQLIEKYDNAETSLQEEQSLKEYFTNDQVAPEFEQYKPMFVYFTESSSERFTKTIPFQKRKSAHWKWLSIAAALVLTFSVFQYSNSSFDQPTRAEAEIALAETKKAFQLLSSNLNKGKNMAFVGIKEFDDATNKVFK